MSGRGARFLADLARDRVESAAYDRVADVVGPHAQRFMNAKRTAHRIAGLGDALHATGEIRAYGRNQTPPSGAVWVSGELFHGPDERKRALAALSTDFAALQNDLAISANPATELAWLHAVVDPILADWHTFLTKVNQSDLSVFTLEWSALEDWHERLVRLRELARTRGIALVSPEPTPLPKTIWERGGSGTGSAADTIVSFLKVGVFAVIAVTGFVGFFSVVKTWRDKSRDAREREEHGHGA